MEVAAAITGAGHDAGKVAGEAADPDITSDALHEALEKINSRCVLCGAYIAE